MVIFTLVAPDLMAARLPFHRDDRVFLDPINFYQLSADATPFIRFEMDRGVPIKGILKKITADYCKNRLRNEKQCTDYFARNRLAIWAQGRTSQYKKTFQDIRA